MTGSAEESTAATKTPPRRRASRRQRMGLEQAAQAVREAQDAEVGGILGGPSVVALYPQHHSGTDQAVTGAMTPSGALPTTDGAAAAAEPTGAAPVREAAHTGESLSDGFPKETPPTQPEPGRLPTTAPPAAARSEAEPTHEEFRLWADDVEALSLRYVRGMSDAAGKLSVAVPRRLKMKMERLETFLWQQHRQTLVRDRFFARALQHMTKVEEWRAEARAAQLRREPRVQISPRVSAEVMDRLLDIAKAPPPVPYGALLIVAVEHEFARLGAPAND